VFLHALPRHNHVKGVTFYEAAYHVLALRTNGLYLTADTAYVKRAKRKGHVSLLSEWQKS
jgi:predicted nucleic acid-binding protein